MANLLGPVIEQISREKGIDAQIVREALEDAMVAAAKKFFKTEEDLQARFEPESGTIDVFAVKRIVEEVEDSLTEMSLEEALEVDDTFAVDDYIEIPKPTVDLGRIAAQTAKQVIFQKVREAEREIIFTEFSEQIGQLVNAIVRRNEGRDIVLDIGRTEAILPYSEQSQNEQYKLGDRVRAVIIKVHRLSQGPQIVVSRSDPSLLIRLFEMEIPEVYDGTVVIQNAVREGGERAKVAVTSRDDAVDPVGACVGMKGSRINAVIREMRGEKIDIIKYSQDIVEYTTNALNPAKISNIIVVDPMAKILEVIVGEDQLSLAIGRKGQNVRLAARLLGWEINIKSAAEKKQEILTQMDAITGISSSSSSASADALSDLKGVGGKTVTKLQEAGINSIQDLQAQSVESLSALPGFGPKTAEKLFEVAQAFRASPESETLDGAGQVEEEPEAEAASVSEPAVEESSESEELVAEPVGEANESMGGTEKE
ncbi:MAG: transcription termination factor NusA [Acidobacteriota bacterium]